MTDDEFHEKVIARFNRLDERMGDLEGRVADLQAEMELRFAVVATKDDALHIERILNDLSLVLLRHVTDPGAHGKAA